MTKVGLVKGDDRFTNVFQALANAGEEVKQKVRGKVVIKVNIVMKGAPLANTHPEALRAVLEFLKPLNPDQVLVGEASGDPIERFRECDFFALQDEYPFDFLDFNTTGYEELELLSTDMRPLTVRITRAYKESDCLISLSVPKAHSEAVVTLSGKNMMGFLAEGEQWKIHGIRDFGDDLKGCVRVIHRNLRTLLEKVRPNVAVLDGFHSFDGGPTPQCARGNKVDVKVAVAGSDFVAVDTVMAEVLGFNTQDIGYLVYSAEEGYGTCDLSEIEVMGTPIREARRPLEPAPRMDVLLSWRD
ncbi:MAG: DUF362 domain-containing protein [Anaerolineae bacterium]